LTTKIWLRYRLAQILEPKLLAHEILKFTRASYMQNYLLKFDFACNLA